MELWRPVGLKELELMLKTDMRSFPPRLPEQPIFYPVLNVGYAKQIASDWNTKEPDAAGFVCHFEIGDEYGDSFERHVVGGQEHEELWIPADEIDEFNRRIIGPVTIVAAFFGDEYRGPVPKPFALSNKNAVEQFEALASHLDDSGFDVWMEIVANRDVIFANFLFWQQHCMGNTELLPAKQRLLEFIRYRWENVKFSFPLPVALHE